MTTDTKTKLIVLGGFVLNQMIWIKTTNLLLNENVGLLKQAKRMNDFAHILVSVIKERDPYIMQDSRIQEFIWNTEFELIVENS